jgi:hypothetical protein
MATKQKTQQELDEEEKKKAEQAAATPELTSVTLPNAAPSAGTTGETLNTQVVPGGTTYDPITKTIRVATTSTAPVVPLSTEESTTAPTFRTGVSQTTPAMEFLEPAADAVARPAAPAPAPAPALASAPAPALASGDNSTGQSAYKPNPNSIIPEVITTKSQAAQDARIANLQTIQTPYGEIKATPEQAARYNKSPEMVQLEIDALKKAPYGGKPLTDEERKKLSPEEFDRRVKEAYAPVTRKEMDTREAQIRELENKRNRLAGEARDEKFLQNMDTLRKNRKTVMDADRKNFPAGKKGDKAFEAKWNSPAYRSIVDQQDQLFIYGKEAPPKKENPEWFKAYQDKSVSMTGGGVGSDEVAREVDRMRRAETAARQRSMGRRVTSAGAPRKSSTKELEERAVAAIAGKRRVANATQEARFTEEEAQKANRELIKKFNEVAVEDPDLQDMDPNEVVRVLGPVRARKFLEKEIQLRDTKRPTMTAPGPK